MPADPQKARAQAAMPSSIELLGVLVRALGAKHDAPGWALQVLRSKTSSRGMASWELLREAHYALADIATLAARRVGDDAVREAANVFTGIVHCVAMRQLDNDVQPSEIPTLGPLSLHALEVTEGLADHALCHGAAEAFADDVKAVAALRREIMRASGISWLSQYELFVTRLPKNGCQRQLGVR
jgi:hypothetical protein